MLRRAKLAGRMPSWAMQYIRRLTARRKPSMLVESAAKSTTDMSATPVWPSAADAALKVGSEARPSRFPASAM